MVQPTTGHAEFILTYSAVVFKPFKNEVIDGVVTTVNKVGISIKIISYGYRLDSGQM